MKKKKKKKKMPCKLENVVRKGEIACNKQFLTTFFTKTYIFGASKCSMSGNGLKQQQEVRSEFR